MLIVPVSIRYPFPAQLLAQLQEGDTLATATLGAVRSPGAEKEALQTRLDEVRRPFPFSGVAADRSDAVCCQR